jgi:hypothetical protein
MSPLNKHSGFAISPSTVGAILSTLPFLPTKG